MKRVLFALAIVFLSATSQAARTTSFDGIFGYSMADKFNIKGASDAKSETAFILGAKLSSYFAKNLGWNSALALETIRDFKYSSAELGFVLLEGNMFLDLDDSKMVYGFAGLNYPLVLLDKHIDTEPALGIQFGTGFRFLSQWSTEIYYRTTNIEINGRNANLWGFAFRLGYSFFSF